MTCAGDTQWEPELRDIPDDVYPYEPEACVDCNGRFEEFLCLSCGLTQTDIENRLVKR